MSATGGPSGGPPTRPGSASMSDERGDTETRRTRCRPKSERHRKRRQRRKGRLPSALAVPVSEAEVVTLRAAGEPFGMSARQVLIHVLRVLTAEPVLLKNLID